MSSFTIPIVTTARSVAIAALLGATMLTTPFSAARADSAITGSIPKAQPAGPEKQATVATETKGETVEQRITDLHAALKITPNQEAQWKMVAQDMRENAAAMDKLIAETRATPPQDITAVTDLQMYQKFAQAHVDGLKNLLSHFKALYAAMPDVQKKVADAVFASTRRAANASKD